MIDVYMQTQGSSYGPESIEKLEASTVRVMYDCIARLGWYHDQTTVSILQVEVFRMVKQFVGYSEDGEEHMPEGSPLLAPLSPPPFDPEVAKLEDAVQEASNRVQKIRVEMQTAIEEKVKKNILEKLPSLDEPDTDVPPPEMPGGSNVDPEELKRILADAAARMPGLKARLEDVYDKMHKIIGSLEEDSTKLAAPNTAERALKRLYDEPQSLDITEDVSKRLQ